LVNEREIVSYLCEQYGCPPSKVVVVPNGIDPERLRKRRSREAVRQELVTPQEIPVVLFAGRLEAVKNIPLLLESFVELIKSGKDARLWIVGDGSEKDAVLRRIEELSLRDKVIVTGVRPDLPDLLHAADLFVLCSHSEGLPNVVLEAMGCGKPVIVSPNSGCREAVDDGTSGWISPDQRPSTYCRLITQCLEHTEEMKRIGENARAVVQDRYTPDTMVCQVASFYNRILDGCNPKG
jgi:glycosyltransferase involved in cell wall biosynthesis